MNGGHHSWEREWDWGGWREWSDNRDGEASFLIG